MNSVYVGAIRVIYEPSPGTSMDDAAAVARAAGFKAMSFNGKVWIVTSDDYIESPFFITDFER